VPTVQTTSICAKHVETEFEKTSIIQAFSWKLHFSFEAFIILWVA